MQSLDQIIDSIAKSFLQLAEFGFRENCQVFSQSSERIASEWQSERARGGEGGRRCSCQTGRDGELSASSTKWSRRRFTSHDVRYIWIIKTMLESNIRNQLKIPLF